MKPIRTLSPEQARQLAIMRQHLAGKQAPANKRSILNIVRDLGCLQIDPISAVARSPYLVLWSRLGAYDPADLHTLLWHDRKLFEYWAHCASIVLTEDFPIHSWLMRNHASDDSLWSSRVREWLKDNRSLLRAVMNRIRRQGPIPSRDLAEAGAAPRAWISTGWTSGRNVSRMLDFLWMQGKIMVAGRDGLQKTWDLSERCLPEWTPREKWSEREIVRAAAQRSLRALGVATAQQISRHYVRGRYPNLQNALDELETEKRIEQVQIVEDDATWRGVWYIHADDLLLLDRMDQKWEPRTTLLSPFDNLICDRARTQLLFGFDYTIEIYVPAAQRKYGYYVLPILHGDQLIGRIDSKMDRQQNLLQINAVYAEPNAPKTKRTARAIADAIEELGTFLGASEISVSHRVPAAWKRDLRRF
ncbi:MAG TPA: crosslink repair DNA glycosylase YcaQ family protein [Anaerolineae bacterium]